MGEIIAIANQKGGVAKTTITHNLGAALATKGKKTLMVDLDSQASLTFCASIKSPLEYQGCNIVAALDPESNKDLNNCVVSVGATDAVKQNLFLVPSIIDLAVTENRINALKFREQFLARKLAQVVDKYDFILLDCPPQLGLLTISALSAADGVIIPCKTDLLAYRGLQQLMQTIDEIREYANHDLKIYGVIGTMYQSRVNQDNQILERLTSEFRYITTIKQAAVAKKGVFDGISAVEYAPGHEISIEVMKVADQLISGEIRRNAV